MTIILDIFLIASILICCFSAMKKGFIKSLLELVGGFAGFIFALIFAGSLGNIISERWIGPFFDKNMTSYVSNLFEKSNAVNGETGSGFNSLLKTFGLSLDKIRSTVIGNTIDKAGDKSVNFVSATAAQKVSYIVAFILIFIGVTIACAILARVLGVIFKLPVLHQFDSLLGLAVGIISALIFGWVFSAAVYYILPMLGDTNFLGISTSSYGSTFLFKYFLDTNPLIALLG
ncbi:MAG: CvpA family protein [Bacillota bacterium]|nr:CvpA family protein [Bacillota bacterium]